MLSPLASVSALETRLGMAEGSLSGGDLARAGAALEDASALARDEGRSTWTSVDVPATVALVVLRAALREFRNPEGFTSESLGDYSYTFANGGDSGVYLTPDELASVRKAAGRSGVRSIRTPSAYGDGRTGTVYVPADNGGDLIPWADL